MKSAWGDRVIGLAFIAAGIWLAGHALGFPAGGNQFPVFLSVCMALIGSVMVTVSVVSPRRYRHGPCDNARKPPWKPLTMVCLVSLYVLASFSLGYYVATTAFLLGAPLVSGFRRSVPIAVCAVVCVVVIYGLFGLALPVDMPSGIVY